MSKKLTTEEFIEKAIAVHGDKYDYSLVKYDGNKTKVKIICPRHGEWEQRPNCHMMGHGCMRCKAEDINSQQRTDPKEFVKKAKKIHPEYDYSKCNYINSFIKVIVICPIHGEFKTTPADHLGYKAGCPICNTSRGEKKIRNILTGLGIDFEWQKRFSECKYKRSLPFDFFLPDYNTLIEFDGEHHYKVIKAWGGLEVYKDTVKRDKIKNKWAEQSPYTLVRIRYDEDIEEKLQEVIVHNC